MINYFSSELKIRIKNYSSSIINNCSFKTADSNIYITELIKVLKLKNYRYHFVYIDPYGPEGLKFSTIIEISKLNRVDILLHFPTGAIKRNYENWKLKEKNILNDFLGTSLWQKKAADSKYIYKSLVDTLIEQLINLGYSNENIRFANTKDCKDTINLAAIKNTKTVKLYELILISKHNIARFWF